MDNHRVRLWGRIIRWVINFAMFPYLSKLVKSYRLPHRLNTNSCNL
jgi:hypothetical protein